MIHSISVRSLILGACFLLLASPALAERDPDPWEGWNQRVFTFNQYFDDYLARPVAETYVDVVPRPAQRGVRNFFSNLNDVTVLVNNLLQAKFRDAASDTGRILVNTTIGLGGLLDVASDAGFERNHEDFGQTLGRWGVGPGPYLVLPFMGPSTVRDAFGFATDIYTGPVSSPDQVRLRNSLYGMYMLNTRVQALQLDSMMYGDQYIFMRDAYLQQRAYDVSDGAVDEDFDDDWSWDD